MKNKYNPVSGEFDLVNSLQDISYVHTQSVPATTWVVTHNLNTKCSVQVVDEDQNEINRINEESRQELERLKKERDEELGKI